MQPKFVCLKETKERSSEKTPFTIITQTASPKKHKFETPKTISQIKKKNHFRIKQLFSVDPTM